MSDTVLGCFMIVGALVVAIVIIAIACLIQSQVIVWAWADLQPIIERAISAKAIPIGEALHIVFWLVVTAWVGLGARRIVSNKK